MLIWRYSENLLPREIIVSDDMDQELRLASIQFGTKLVSAFDARLSTLGYDPTPPSGEDSATIDAIQVKLDAYQDKVIEALRQLLCQRLLHDDRSVPLLDDGDIYVLIFQVNTEWGEYAGDVDDQLVRLSVQEYMRRTLQAYIAANVGEDPYDVLNREVATALAVAAEYPGLSPEDLAATDTAFCEYIRRSTTIEVWDRDREIEFEDDSRMGFGEAIGQEAFANMVNLQVLQLAPEELPHFYARLAESEAEINLQYVQDAIGRRAEMDLWRARIWPDA